MNGTNWTRDFAAALLVGLALSGCANKEADQSGKDAETPAVAQTDPSHGGWWCVEHGVPEDVCTRCSTHLAAAFQQKGDWCEQHDLPDSQCFVCHPELEAKFAAQYEAKTGQKPPEPTE